MGQLAMRRSDCAPGSVKAGLVGCSESVGCVKLIAVRVQTVGQFQGRAMKRAFAPFNTFSAWSILRERAASDFSLAK
jgi:hypothetical protein